MGKASTLRCHQSKFLSALTVQKKGSGDVFLMCVCVVITRENVSQLRARGVSVNWRPMDASFYASAQEPGRCAPRSGWEKVKQLKWCFVSRLFCERRAFFDSHVPEKGSTGRGRRPVILQWGLYCSGARRCQTLLPAEMTLGTRSSCANTAALLSTHSRSG